MSQNKSTIQQFFIMKISQCPFNFWYGLQHCVFPFLFVISYSYLIICMLFHFYILVLYHFVCSIILFLLSFCVMIFYVKTQIDILKNKTQRKLIYKNTHVNHIGFAAIFCVIHGGWNSILQHFLATTMNTASANGNHHYERVNNKEHVNLILKKGVHCRQDPQGVLYSNLLHKWALAPGCCYTNLSLYAIK